MGIFFGILNAIVAALGKTFLKKGFDNLSSSVSFTIETLFGVIFWTLFGLIKGIDINNIIRIFPIIVISAILSEAYIFYVYTKGKLSLVVPVFATYSIFTIFFSNILINERLTFSQSAFITLTIIGIIILSINKDFKIKGNKDLATILWALSGAVAVGVSDTISKSVIDMTSSAEFLVGLGIAQIFVAIAFMKIERQKSLQFIQVFKNPKLHINSLIGSLLIAISMIFFWLSFENTLASIASPITATNVMFVIIFSLTLLKEKITIKNAIGLGFVVISLIGINILA